MVYRWPIRPSAHYGAARSICSGKGQASQPLGEKETVNIKSFLAIIRQRLTRRVRNLPNGRPSTTQAGARSRFAAAPRCGPQTTQLALRASVAARLKSTSSSGHGGVILGRGAVVVINDYVWVERKFGDPDGGHARAADTADLITAAGALATAGTTAAAELPLRQALALRLLAIGTAGPTGAGGLRRGPCNAGRRHPCCAGCHPGNPRPRLQLPRWQLPAARLRAPQSPAARSLTLARQDSLGVAPDGRPRLRAPSAIATYATRITLRRPSASSGPASCFSPCR
jgi:hypothetical protein